MQEDIENRSVNLAITTTRLTSQALIQGWRAYRALGQYEKDLQAKITDREAGKTNKTGKMTVKELVAKDEGVTSLDIGKTKIKDFDRIAQKYGIDYAVVKDKNFDPPHYTVFFKSKEEDAMTAAFTEYTAEALKKNRKPSVLQTLKKFKELVALIPVKIRDRQRER